MDPYSKNFVKISSIHSHVVARRIVMYICEGVRTKRILRAVRQSQKLQPSGYSSLNSVVPAKSTLKQDSLYGFAGNTFLFGRTTRSNCSPGYVHCLAKWAHVLVLFLSSTGGWEQVESTCQCTDRFAFPYVSSLWANLKYKY